MRSYMDLQFFMTMQISKHKISTDFGNSDK